ncbi:ferredoxin [Amycolatopsis anabasis]|uniref:ferredoxin n=1 Tax=Amycolatopsis anabasis TaxID=1840409 RepID=UPI00131DDC5E|nr:ferredoxin [Amycolatopsis anabasis]
MRVLVDRSKCTGLGICESLAPEHFEVNDDGDLVLLDENVDERAMADVEQAVASCPTEALRLER